MAKPVMRKVTVFSDTSPYFPSDPKEFMEYFQSKLDKVPNEFKDSARIEIDTDYCGDYSKITLDIFYFRPETSEEARERKAEEKAYEIL